tara:strand:- start:58 stop:807 length:750 start_codon:yes stop_codon:yes gene_type:complete
MITVALPTWDASPILWLQIESLCRQETEYEWELIVCEDPSDNFAGEEYFDPYLERLKKAGMVNFKYIKLDRWVPLSLKWVWIAQEAQFENFALFSSDDYSHKDRLQVSVDSLKDALWVDWNQGLFLDLMKWTTGMYKKRVHGNQNLKRTGLFMSTKTELVRSIKDNVYPARGVDGWIRKNTGIKMNNVVQIDECPLALCTDSFNQISMERKSLYADGAFKEPFYSTHRTIFEMLPRDVLMELVQKFKAI